MCLEGNIMHQYCFQNYYLLFLLYKSIPAPKLPPISLFSDVLSDAIGLAIVSFAINISMAKMFAKKYKYDISANQVIYL